MFFLVKTRGPETRQSFKDSRLQSVNCKLFLGHQSGSGRPSCHKSAHNRKMSQGKKTSKINGTRSAARPRLDAADVDRVEFYCRPEMVFINTQNSAKSKDAGRRTKDAGQDGRIAGWHDGVMAAADTYGRGQCNYLGAECKCSTLYVRKRETGHSP